MKSAQVTWPTWQQQRLQKCPAIGLTWPGVNLANNWLAACCSPLVAGRSLCPARRPRRQNRNLTNWVWRVRALIGLLVTYRLCVAAGWPVFFCTLKQFSFGGRLQVACSPSLVLFCGSKFGLRFGLGALGAPGDVDSCLSSWLASNWTFAWVSVLLLLLFAGLLVVDLLVSPVVGLHWLLRLAGCC